MVEHTPAYHSYDPDIDPYEERPADRGVAHYRFGSSNRAYPGHDNSMPLFLSDNDGEPLPSEYMAPVRVPLRKSAISARILAGVLTLAAGAILFALFSSDATREIIVDAKASIPALLPSPSAAAQPDPSRLTAKDVQLKDPTRLSAPFNQMPGARVASVETAATPSRAEITNAYQSALQGRPGNAVVPAAAAPVAAAPATAASAAAVEPSARKLDAEELATLMNRAKTLLTAGDIPPARLLLERAADAGQPGAALMLAQTYDPLVLGAQDLRSITPDPATARVWYQKAAQLGSADAQLRLNQMQN